jgi:integrase
MLAIVSSDAVRVDFVVRLVRVMGLTEQCGRFALSLEETAEKLGLTVSDVESLIDGGELSAKKVGEKRIVPLSSLGKYLGLEEQGYQSYNTTSNDEKEVVCLETPYGSGSILYVKARDAFRYAISQGKDPVTGKRNRIIKGDFRSREEAEDALREALKGLSTVVHTPVAPAMPANVGKPRITVEEYLDKNLLSFYPKATDRTLHCYATAAKTLVKLIGNLYLDELTRTNLQNALNSLTDKADSTINKIYLILKKMVEIAVDDELIPKNVAAKVVCPKSRKLDTRSEDDRVYSSEQISAILKAAKGEDDPLLFTALLLFAFTGMRPEELRGLEKQDFDPDAKTLNIRQAATTRPQLKLDNALAGDVGPRIPVISKTKSKSGVRTLYLDDQVISALQKWLAYLKETDPVRYNSDFLFPNMDGGILRDDVLNTKFTRFRKRHGFTKNFTFYRFRHTFCTNMARAHVDIKTIMRLLGDSSVSVVLETYTHVPDADAKRANEEMNRVYANMLPDVLDSDNTK